MFVGTEEKNAKYSESKWQASEPRTEPLTSQISSIFVNHKNVQLCQKVKKKKCFFSIWQGNAWQRFINMLPSQKKIIDGKKIQPWKRKATLSCIVERCVDLLANRLLSHEKQLYVRWNSGIDRSTKARKFYVFISTNLLLLLLLLLFLLLLLLSSFSAFSTPSSLLLLLLLFLLIILLLLLLLLFLLLLLLLALQPLWILASSKTDLHYFTYRLNL